jgi:hypothetical protein
MIQLFDVCEFQDISINFQKQGFFLTTLYATEVLYQIDDASLFLLLVVAVFMNLACSCEEVTIYNHFHFVYKVVPSVHFGSVFLLLR